MQRDITKKPIDKLKWNCKKYWINVREGSNGKKKPEEQNTDGQQKVKQYTYIPPHRSLVG